MFLFSWEKCSIKWNQHHKRQIFTESVPESSELPDTVQLNSNTNEGSIVSSTEPTEQPDSSENADTTEAPTSRYFCYPIENLPHGWSQNLQYQLSRINLSFSEIKTDHFSSKQTRRKHCQLPVSQMWKQGSVKKRRDNFDRRRDPSSAASNEQGCGRRRFWKNCQLSWGTTNYVWPNPW